MITYLVEYLCILLIVLDIDRLNEVFCCVVTLRSQWKTIGLKLGMNYDIIEAIEKEQANLENMLMALLASWLRRQSNDQPKPSWKNLCDALQIADKTKADEIAKKHQCDCDECIGEFLKSLRKYCISLSISNDT